MDFQHGKIYRMPNGELVMPQGREMGWHQMISLSGFVFFYTSAIVTLVITLCVLADDWRERHGGTTAPHTR